MFRSSGALFLIFCLPLLLQAQKERLMAPAYPGTVKELVNAQPGAATFYTKEKAEKVVSYYEQLFGKAERNENNGSYFIKVDLENQDGSAIIDDIKVGVTVKSKPLKYNYFVSQAMAQLQSAYLARFTGTSTQDKMKHINDPELQTVLNQYEYLKSSFFLQIKVPSNGGSDMYQGIEEMLYDKFFASPEEVRERKMNELMEQYTRMIQQGNMDEASKISDRMNSLSRASAETTDKWASAISYLKELEKLAYTTMIVVDKKP